jgi:hypothetical protein
MTALRKHPQPTSEPTQDRGALAKMVMALPA